MQAHEEAAVAQPPAPAVRAYRFTLDPTPAQVADFARHTGAARWAFNYALAAKTAAHADWRTQVDALVAPGVDEAAARRLVKVPTPQLPAVARAWRDTRGDTRTWEPTPEEAADPEVRAPGVCPWWHEVSSKAFVQAFRDADRAWSNWLSSLKGERAGRKVGYPRFKKRGRSRDSFRLEGSVRPDGYRHLVLPRIGSVRLHQTAKPLVRALERHGGRIISVTVSRGAQRWYASVLVTFPTAVPEQRQATRAQRRAGAVGVDLGVKPLAALSAQAEDGTMSEVLVANPRHTARGARRLGKAQRALSRTQRGSHRRTKAARTVARRHAEVATQRATSIHALTKRLASRYAVVAIEDLAVAGMTRSARGTAEAPGRNVAAKTGLNRAIADAGLGEVRRQLAYKTRWYGSRLHVVDRWAPTSKTCSGCGRRNPSLSLSERTRNCPCGLVLDRDLNAARNIRTAALNPVVWAAAVACGARETSNARRGPVSPASRQAGGQGPLKREDHPAPSGRTLVTSGR